MNKSLVGVNRKQLAEIARSAFRRWQKHNASLRAAALAFFIILPLPSLLLIILAILAQIYGEADAYQALIQQISSLAGPAVANLIGQLLNVVKTPFTSAFATITTVGFTIGGAVGAFSVLQDTMDEMWGMTSLKGLNVVKRIRMKIVPFLLVFSLGFGVMIWTGVTTILLGVISSALNPLAHSVVPVILRIAQVGFSFVLATLLFAVIYKQIPEMQVQWREVGLAAIITGLVFTLTNYLIGTFIEVFTITSVTGAAGSLMILLLWIFLINQFVLYGAAFSRTYTEKTRLYSSEQREKEVDVTARLQELGQDLAKYKDELVSQFKDLEIEFKEWDYSVGKTDTEYTVDINLNFAVKPRKES